MKYTINAELDVYEKIGEPPKRETLTMENISLETLIEVVDTLRMIGATGTMITGAEGKA
jgi:hypothetical protein